MTSLWNVLVLARVRAVSDLMAYKRSSADLAIGQHGIFKVRNKHAGCSVRHRLRVHKGARGAYL